MPTQRWSVIQIVRQRYSLATCLLNIAVQSEAEHTFGHDEIRTLTQLKPNAFTTKFATSHVDLKPNSINPTLKHPIKSHTDPIPRLVPLFVAIDRNARNFPPSSLIKMNPNTLRINQRLDNASFRKTIFGTVN
ncbi:hypothetical protein CBM2629_B90094 [Cupriavidus taiwanensis]|nr:hypothetical protein CBM2629_B90094 [Cupriavidus taiwanensis]